ncbi:hypothetical protein [Streptomyces sp. NPDC048157]|uniref:hypothetical protein n=1 Tax=Streptomyces sp. NPDC048157 TaxID=3365503 RepID=UPI003721FB3B
MDLVIDFVRRLTAEIRVAPFTMAVHGTATGSSAFVADKPPEEPLDFETRRIGRSAKTSLLLQNCWIPANGPSGPIVMGGAEESL